MMHVSKVGARALGARMRLLHQAKLSYRVMPQYMTSQLPQSAGIRLFSSDQDPKKPDEKNKETSEEDADAREGGGRKTPSAFEKLLRRTR